MVLRRRLDALSSGIVEAVLGALMLVTVVFSYTVDRPIHPLRFAVEVLICVAAGAVGRWMLPGSIAVGIGLVILVTLPTPDSNWAVVAMLIPIASAGARGRFRWRSLITAWYLIAAALIEAGVARNIDRVFQGALTWAFVIALVWLLGQAIWSFARQTVALRAERVAAVHAQRRSIARDLHDTIAYSTTSIILRAEQAKLRGVTDPELLADLDHIIAAGRRSMRDLRGMMETLRRNESDLAHGLESGSPWRISSLADVLTDRIGELTRQGFHVTHHVDADLDALPESIRETLAKVVVEATANIVKHAAPNSQCSILIEAGDGQIEAAFINEPAERVESGLLRGQPNHLGLIGARERVEALGGECVVSSDRPWVLTVTLPLES